MAFEVEIDAALEGHTDAVTAAVAASLGPRIRYGMWRLRISTTDRDDRILVSLIRPSGEVSDLIVRVLDGIPQVPHRIGFD